MHLGAKIVSQACQFAAQLCDALLRLGRVGKPAQFAHHVDGIGGERAHEFEQSLEFGHDARVECTGRVEFQSALLLDSALPATGRKRPARRVETCGLSGLHVRGGLPGAEG